MSNWTDYLRESLQDDDMRAGFAAEGVKTKFAHALLNARESRGISQTRLAEICGVSQAYISKLESGEANPTIGKMGAIFGAMWLEPTIGFEAMMPEDSDSESARSDYAEQDTADRASAGLEVVGSAVDDD